MCAPAEVLNVPETLIVAVYLIGRGIVLLDYQSISLTASRIYVSVHL